MKLEIRPDEIDTLPNQPAVFLLWPREGQPYLARTGLLRRRLLRLLREREQPSRLLNLRSLIERIEYWLTASRLESNLLLFELARQHFPDNYLKMVKLRMPTYVRLTLANEFPRASVTAKLGGGRSVCYGPFRTRAGAELFEAQFLDLFQLRRCQENLEPHPDHPGCIYGEMNMCLRPCQQVVGVAEYRSEVGRVVEFLETSGTSLLEITAAARERSSEEMDFEEAARQHKRYQQIEQVLALRDDLVADVEALYGVAITLALDPDAVELRFMERGVWRPAITFSLAISEGKMVPMDRRLRETLATGALESPPITDRQEHLALLARWYYSTWRDGEWIGCSSLEKLPYRKLVNAISRVAKRGV